MRSGESSGSEESALITEISRGDEDAFLLLYDRFSGPLHGLLQTMLHSKDDAEEVLQTVFLQVWKKAGSYQSDRCSAFTWLVMITRSKAIDRIRQRDRRNRTVEAVTVESSVAEEGSALDAGGIVQHEDQAAVRAALQLLPIDQREAIEMAFFKGMSQTEISTALSEPLGTVKSRIRRGMLRLRDSLIRRE